MKTWIWKNKAALLLIAVVALATTWAVQHYRKSGQLDVISAQAMDMSQMRPPTGAAPVELTSIKRGGLAEVVTYTGTVRALNEQDISPRITGTIVDLPVYPGDNVRTGELVAQLDSAEVSAKADAAAAAARQAALTQTSATLNHHLHHYAALDQADSQLAAAKQSVDDARAQVQGAKDAVDEARAGVTTAKANVDYWNAEIVREKQLYDAGAVSRQDYQNEVAQAESARAALSASRSKVAQAQSAERSAAARVQAANDAVKAAGAARKMAVADLDVAASQVQEAAAGADAARASAREAAVVQSYTRIAAPIAGVVTQRPVAPGTLVQPGTVILKIAEIDRIRVQANVAVVDLVGIGVGSPVQIALQDGTKTLAARVSSVFPSADPQTRTAVVEAVVDNPGHRLLPGAFVTMRISKSTSADKMLVPASAVMVEGGQSYVWLARAAGATPGDVKYKAACGFIYSAADAKKYNYICPMDHKKLVPIRSATPSTANGPITATRIAVDTGATDGVSTEVSSPELMPADQIITRGTAGLVEGARVVKAEWGVDGPKALPTAAAADAGMTVYRCDKCGMTYSAADAKKHNFIDPMDGGNLVPVREGK